MSTITITRGEARRLAEKKLNHIYIKREALSQAFLKKEAARRNATFFRRTIGRLLRLRPVTEADVEASDNSKPAWDSELWHISYRFNVTEDFCHQIIKFCEEHDNSVIELDLDDMEKLS